MHTLFIMVALVLFFTFAENGELLFVCMLGLLMLYIYTMPFIASYKDYKQMKAHEIHLQESKRARDAYEHRKKIESAKWSKSVESHGKQLYLDIVIGKRPAINFDEIKMEVIDENNPKVVNFCKKNNITVNDLFVLNSIN